MNGRFDRILTMLESGKLGSYERKELGPALNFHDVPSMLISISKDLSAAALMEEHDFPSNRLDSIENTLNGLMETLKNILSWQPAQGDPNTSNTHSAAIGQVRNARDTIAEQIRPLLRPDPGEIPQSLRETSDMLSQALVAADRINEIISAHQTASVQQANYDVSRYFKRAADDHRRAAFWYLMSAGAFAVLLAIGVIIMFFLIPPAINSIEQAVRATLGRVTLLLVGAAGVAFCTKNYRVNKHLEVMNQTRYNALMTASKYVEGVTDDARNLVVAELVRSIFSPGDTGYMSTDREQTIIENPGSLVSLLNSNGVKGAS